MTPLPSPVEGDRASSVWEAGEGIGLGIDCGLGGFTETPWPSPVDGDRANSGWEVGEDNSDGIGADCGGEGKGDIRGMLGLQLPFLHPQVRSIEGIIVL